MVNKTVSRDAWNRLIAAPLVIADKMEAPLSIWGKCTDMVQVDCEGRIRCIADNLLYINALQIDIDNGYPIDNFVVDYHRYSFQLYTSYSHGFKEGGDRYRVIFPLREPIYTEWLEPPVKKVLHDLFDMVDTTCFDKCHWQIFPCVRSNDAPYRFMQHEGEILSFASDNFADKAAEYREGRHWRKEIANADKDPNSNHQGAMDFVQKTFDSVQEGARNKTMYSKLRWLHDTVGADYNEVMTLRSPTGMESEMSSMIDRIWYGK